MCGIVGIIKKARKSINSLDTGLFHDMMVCDSIRGADSTGAFVIDHNLNAHFVKAATQPYHLLQSNAYHEFIRTAYMDGQVLIGHNRKASEGQVINENAHPFTSGPITLVHNGLISNFRTLVPIKTRNKLGINVDSHGAAYLLSMNSPEKILPEMKGAFAFVWYNALTKELNFIRNDERPLWFGESDTAHYFASEGPMLRWLLGRENVKLLNNNTIHAFLAGKLATFDLSVTPPKLRTSDVKFEDKPVTNYTAPAGYVRSANGVWRLPEKPTSSLTAIREAMTSARQAELNDAHRADLPQANGKSFNIHYGQNRTVDEDIPNQYIVWSIVDYKEIIPKKPSRVQYWLIWGNALNSPDIEVKGTFVGTEKVLDGLINADHIIGKVTRVKNKVTAGTKEGLTLAYQEVMTDFNLPVELIKKQDTHMTMAHYEYLLAQDTCECQVSYSANEDNNPQFTYHPFENRVMMQCTWCRQADLELKAASEKTTHPAVQTRQ